MLLIFSNNLESRNRQPEWKSLLLRSIQENQPTTEVLDITPLLTSLQFDHILYALRNKNEFNGLLDKIIALQLHLRPDMVNLEEFKRFVLSFSDSAHFRPTFIKIGEDINSMLPSEIIVDELIIDEIVFLRFKSGINIKHTFSRQFVRRETLITEFYQQIQENLNLSKAEVHDIVISCCSQAKSLDGMPMKTMHALRILSGFNWHELNEKYTSIADMLQKLYNEQEVCDEIYHLQQEQNLHFYMTKVNGNNVYIWRDYALQQRYLSLQYQGNDLAIRKADAGIKGFLPSLNFHDQNFTETWVAFVTNEIWVDHRKIDHLATEMYVSILTSENARFTGHIGITRSVSYNGVKHNDLATMLHCFIAQATLEHYKSKIYMINVPAARMREILVNQFFDNNKGSEIFICDDQIKYEFESLEQLIQNQKTMKAEQFDKSDKEELVRAFEKNELAIALLKQKSTIDSGNKPIPITVTKDQTSNDYLRFVIFAANREILHDLEPRDMAGEFSWFFDSPWFVRNQRHPVVTYCLQALAALTKFNSPIVHEFRSGHIGDKPVSKHSRSLLLS